MKKTTTLSKNKITTNKSNTANNKSDSNLVELLESIFKEKQDKNKKILQAKIIKETERKIINLSTKNSIKPDELNKLTSMIKVTDPIFKVVSDLALLSTNRRIKIVESVRLFLMEFCTSVISSCSILKSDQKNDIYKDFFEDKNSNNLSKLHSEIKEKYKKRIKGKRLIDENKNQEKNNDTSDLYKKEIKILEKECDNVITIGAIYALFHGYVTHNQVIEYFLAEFYSYKASEEIVVCFYLIENRDKNDIRKSLFYLKNQLDNKNKEVKNIQQELSLKYKECDSYQEELKNKDKEIKDLSIINQENIRKIKELENELEELGQNEKAKRVHLYDDTEQAKARAINLLEGELLEPIKLCLSALRRKNPKVEVASFKLEIIEENIEKGLKWFKK